MRSFSLLSVFSPILLFSITWGGCCSDPKTVKEPDEKQVHLRLRMPAGESVQITCDPNTQFSIKIQGQLYGFAIGESGEKTSVRIMQALQIDSATMTVAKTAIKELDNLTLPIGKDSSQLIRTSAGFEIQSLDAVYAGRMAGAFNSGGHCCVTCGRTRACGCAVEMDCGSCCAGQCCTGTGGRLPVFML